MKINKNTLWGAVFVSFVTAIVFFPILKGDFLNWDDHVLLLENYKFRGLGWENLKWMSSTFFCGHWQPLSWISYAFDYLIWGMNPHGWHVTNWLLHVVNSGLVFLICMFFLNKADGLSGLLSGVFGALFYAVHPLRVEPVAWLSTRGYLLGGTFYLLTILFYLNAGNRKRRCLGAPLLFFMLASLSKGIGMMLPLALLLVDWFALGRIKSFREAVACIAEKWAFFLISLFAGVMAFLAKNAEGGMASLSNYSAAKRLGQAVFGVWFYIEKTILPLKLSSLYNNPPTARQLTVVFLLTAVFSVVFFIFRRRLRCVMAFAGVSLLLIFPMIGITQSGSQLFADRFTYLASVPLSVMIAVGLSRMVHFRRIVYGGVFVLLFICGVQSFVWSMAWRESLTLWGNAVSVDPQNPRAYNNLGLAFRNAEAHQKSLECFDKAVQLDPLYVLAWHNRSVSLMMLGRYDQALDGWKRCLSISKMTPEERLGVLRLRGWVLEQTENYAAAERDYSFVINDPACAPDLLVSALMLRAKLYVRQGGNADALADLERVLRLPDSSGARHQQAGKLRQLVKIQLDQ
ncbi:tetratricopeptide repeat protein [Tichowtungia aerotolerans]|uniref:Uncharacterized protein n=1 Tax=Tichowtungia aerotolerans TaxID=2697043 RepID=A0A6P1MCK4_9BACT|nr:tetratricopeptide repeat protein [Tichowtungia aerotolerans]QHI70843.1 hypothetical protein GT409_15805 [Tichowtungia aerotolerans]